MAQELETITARTSSKALVGRAVTNEKALKATLTADVARLMKVKEKSDVEQLQLSALSDTCDAKIQAVHKHTIRKFIFLDHF